MESSMLTTLEGLRDALLTPTEVVRDADGYYHHPALPICDEATSMGRFLSAFRIEADYTTMESDAPILMRLVEAHIGAADAIRQWNPTPPEGEGWILLSIYDTEDGPYAYFGRDVPQETPRRRRGALGPNEVYVQHSVATEQNAGTIMHGLLDAYTEVAGAFPDISKQGESKLADTVRTYLPPGSDADAHVIYRFSVLLAQIWSTVRPDMEVSAKAFDSLPKDIAVMQLELDLYRAESEKRYHDLVQRAGHALNILPGSDLFKTLLPAIELLRVENAGEIAMNRAAELLPEGYDMRVCLEKDAGTVEIYDPAGDALTLDIDTESMTRQIIDAVDIAIAHAESDTVPAQENTNAP